MAAPRWPGLRSKVLTVSRLLGRAACARADHLRHEDELALVAGGGTEAMVRGSVIHAGLAAACAAFPAEPDPARVAAACSASAVENDLGARDARLPGWTRVALRAARALDPGAWEPVSLDVASGGSGRVDGAGAGSDAVAGLPGGVDDYTCSTARSAHLTSASIAQFGEMTLEATETKALAVTLVEARVGVALPDGDPRAGDAGRGWVFSFKPDAVLRHRATGRIWLVDHKTKPSLSRVEPWAELHLQALLYVRALRALGVPVHGAVLYAVLADEPTVPKLRNDGHLADRSWATDWPTALEVIRGSADPDPDSPRYDELRRRCAERQWQLPQEVLFDDAELESAWSYLIACRDDLVRDHVRATSISLDAHLPVWRAVHPTGRGAACERCDFREWCTEDFGGRDPEPLVGGAYRRGAGRYLAEVALTRARDDLTYRPAGDLNGIDTLRARP